MFSSFNKCILAMLLTVSWGHCISQVNPLHDFRKEQESRFETIAKRVAAFLDKKPAHGKLFTRDGRELLLVDVEDGVPVYLSGLNFEAALTTGASKIQGGVSGFKLEGKGMLIGVWDDGSVSDHIELDNRVISREVDDAETHATHVTGTLIASGVNPNAKGMAPKAMVTDWYFNNDLAEMSALAKPDQTSLLLSNHSYGTVTGWTKVNSEWNWTGNSSVSSDEDYRFGFYGSKARSLDQLANLAPYYTIVWAAGNDRGEPGDGSVPPDCNGGSGYDCIIPESVAKNIITVGAVNKALTYTSPSSVVMSTFSSWGPTDDGRIKPDIVGAGVNLFSLIADGTDSYGFLSGTSMAAPNVTGSLTLLQELYNKLHGGKFMKSATLKALAIHTAKEAGILPGPDYSFGWGLLDVEAAAKLLVKEDGINIFVSEENLSNNSTYEMVLNPKANQKISVTIAWTDPAADPVAPALDPLNLMLVNDLDIKLVAENGTINYPWLLDPSTPAAQAIKGDNYRDNVEKLEINLPEANPYRLVVSHKGTLVNGSQDFSLIINYQSSQSASNTFYWVGDNGDWGDNSHWSLSTGGSSTGMVPGAADRVIVDENSFDGIGTDQITLNENRSCLGIKWLFSSPAGFNLQGNTLTVGKELSMASDKFIAESGGTIRCSTASSLNGNIYFNENDFSGVNLKIDGGNWNLQGDANIPQLEHSSGNLVVNNSELKVNHFIGTSSEAKGMNFINSILELTQQSDLDGESITISLANSKVNFINATVTLNWDNVNWDGLFELVNAEVTINGKNSIGELSMNPGSALILEGGSHQDFKKIIKLEGEEGNPASISGASKASINFSDHFLYCSDFINVSNVDLNGIAVINVGVNSNIDNAANWKNQSCESVLFADFDEKYLCQNGFAEFTDRSNGSVTSWDWNFSDEGSPINASIFQNAFHEFTNSGTFTVSLAVGDGQTNHTFSKQIEITPSEFEKNQIAVGGEELVSVLTSSSYQWFLNEQKIPGATSRTYNYHSDEGVYRVVINNGSCNLTSDLVTITGFDDETISLNIYPNPTNDQVMIEFKTAGLSQVSITDLLGKERLMTQGYGRVMISTKGLSNGIYLVRVKNQGRELIKKILVNHDN